MTGNSEKLRGLFLAALMVFSVIAMGATFVGPVAADHGNTTLTDGSTYWVGQQLTYDDSVTSGEEWQVRDDDGNLVSEIEAVDDQIVIDTELTGAGDFGLFAPGASSADVEFEVVTQTLRVDASPVRVDNEEPDSVTDIRVRSNRANYLVEVTAEDLSQNELVQIFSDSPHYDQTWGENAILIEASNDRTVAADFDGIDVGEYTLNFDVHDSTAADTTDVTAVDPEDADVSFAETVLIEERGDILEIGLEFRGTATEAEVVFGDSSDVNYEVNMTVTPNDEGVATILWDTSQSANSTHAGFIGTVEDGASVDVFNTPIRDSVSTVVETGEYPVSVAYDGDETDIATAVVEQRSTNGVTVHTAPAGTSSPFEHMSSAEDGETIAVDTDVGTQGVHDWIIIGIDASGLDGYVSDAGDLVSAPGVMLTIEENDATVGTNEDAGEYVVMSGDEFDNTMEDDQYYVAFKASELLGDFDGMANAPDTEVGAQFDVTFTTTAWDGATGNPATEETQSVTAEFQIVDGHSQFDLDGQRIFVSADENAQVTGTSTWAPGTSLSATLRSTGGQAPFTQQNTSMIVDSDGNFAGTFNLAAQPEGQEFTATLRHSEAGQQHQVEGMIGELQAGVSFSDQVAQDAGTLVHIDEATLSEGGFVAVYAGSADGDFLGVSSYLEAGTHSDVRVRLNEPVDDRVTLVAVAHKDTDNNMQFGYIASGGAEDAPYTADGAAVSAQATVSIATEAPTEPPATEEPTDAPTEPPETEEPTDAPTEPPATETDEPEETPGFGLVVALVALMAAALLAVRRSN